MWQRVTRPGPDELHAQLQARLESLDELLPRLKEDVGSTTVSKRELMQARSCTALSCQFTTRQHLSNSVGGEYVQECLSRPSDECFGHPELLEHVLRFVPSPAQLASAGAVCSAWYQASRMHTLWEVHLRASGRLVGPDGSPLPMPQEDAFTLFETAARLERFGGCRPLECAEPPAIGKIDRFVDDLAAYEICGEISESGTAAAGTPLAERPPARGATYVATHHTRGRVTIRSLNAHQSRLYAAQVASGGPLALATSAHLQPVQQAIISATDPPSVHLVQPATHTTLDLVLKLPRPLEEAHAHAIFCQLAHAVQAVHAQRFFHGNVLLPAVLLRDPFRNKTTSPAEHDAELGERAAVSRLPYALLDMLHACKSLGPPPAPQRGPSAAHSRDVRMDHEARRTRAGSQPTAAAPAPEAAATVEPLLRALDAGATVEPLLLQPLDEALDELPDTALMEPTPGTTPGFHGLGLGPGAAATAVPAEQPHAAAGVAAQVTGLLQGTVAAAIAAYAAQTAGPAGMADDMADNMAEIMAENMAELSAGGRSFTELLAWGWAAYERLGTLITGHPGEVDLAHATPSSRRHALLMRSFFAADVCDLGRVLLRMVLQPYKLRAQATAVPVHPAAAAAAAMAQVALPQAGGHQGPPDPSVFPPALQQLLLRMLHPDSARRPMLRDVLRSEWVREPYPGVARPLCCCWKLCDVSRGAQHGATSDEPSVVASDLRLLRRQVPPMTQLNLSHSPIVTDEWLEALEMHAHSLRRLDLTGCASITKTVRPLEALRKLRKLEVLRLPAERWDEQQLADALTALPQLTALDECTHADIRKARDDVKQQCDILSNARQPIAAAPLSRK